MTFQFRGPDTLFNGLDPMIDLFVRDITEGIAGTSMKAAFFKRAIDAMGMTPGVERIMIAVAGTHRRTGVPITVHTNPHNQSGLLALDLLKREGVDLTKVVMGHCGNTDDLAIPDAAGRRGLHPRQGPFRPGPPVAVATAHHHDRRAGPQRPRLSRHADADAAPELVTLPGRRGGRSRVLEELSGSRAHVRSGRRHGSRQPAGRSGGSCDRPR